MYGDGDEPTPVLKGGSQCRWRSWPSDQVELSDISEELASVIVGINIRNGMTEDTP